MVKLIMQLSIPCLTKHKFVKTCGEWRCKYTFFWPCVT